MGVGDGGIYVKPDSESKPWEPDTETLPLDPAPTVAKIVVSDVTAKDCAAVPPKLTEVVPVKPAPKMKTMVPVAPLVGLNNMI